eukprot:1651447-Rhodomonas_salina.2
MTCGTSSSSSSSSSWASAGYTARSPDYHACSIAFRRQHDGNNAHAFLVGIAPSSTHHTHKYAPQSFEHMRCHSTLFVTWGCCGTSGRVRVVRLAEVRVPHAWRHLRDAFRHDARLPAQERGRKQAQVCLHLCWERGHLWRPGSCLCAQGCR